MNRRFLGVHSDGSEIYMDETCEAYYFDGLVNVNAQYTIAPAIAGKLIVVDSYRIIITGQMNRTVNGTEEFGLLYVGSATQPILRTPVRITTAAVSGILYDSGLMRFPTGYYRPIIGNSVVGYALASPAASGTITNYTEAYIYLGYHYETPRVF